MACRWRTRNKLPRLVGIPGARLKIAGLDIRGLHLDPIEYIKPKGGCRRPDQPRWQRRRDLGADQLLHAGSAL